MKTYTFTVVEEPDEDAPGNPAWHASSPALESIGAATSGRTRDEALKNIDEVIHMIVQESVEEGRPIPEGPEDELRLPRDRRKHPVSPLPSKPWPSIIEAPFTHRTGTHRRDTAR